MAAPPRPLKGLHETAAAAPAIAALPDRGFKFGVFEVDPLNGELRREGLKIKLQQKSLQLLLLLIARPGRIVLREEIRTVLWPADTFVDFDANIKTALNKLRQSLGDPAENPVFIETIPKVGYRFIAPVMRLEHLHDASPPSSQSLPSRGGSGFIRRHPLFWTFVTASALVLAVGTAGFYQVRSRSLRARSSSISRPLVLLVLPFDNLSGDPSQEFFSDGVTDEMISLLGQQAPRELSVIARTSAMQYRGVRKPLSEITRELGGADYVLEGSVRRSGSHVAINTELLRLPDQVVLWAGTYERDLDDLLAAQLDVAQRVSYSLLQRLVSSSPSRSFREVDSRAHDAYLMGLYYQSNKRDGENLLRSLDYFKQAIQEDSNYAPAYAALSYSYMVAAGWEMLEPNDAYPKAKAAAEQALRLDPNLSEAHMTLASAEHEYYWKWAEIEPEFRRAIELDPNSSLSHKGYAEFLMHSGRNREAIHEIDRAVALDPLSLGVRLLRAFVYLFARDYERSARESQAIIQADSQFAPAHYLLGGVYAAQGQYDKAISEFELARHWCRGSAKMAAGLARAYALAGRRGDALTLLSALERDSKHHYVSPYSMADAYMGLGDKQHALDLLERAAAEHSSDLLYLRYCPNFESLHDNRRFVRLIRKIGFPAEIE